MNDPCQACIVIRPFSNLYSQDITMQVKPIPKIGLAHNYISIQMEYLANHRGKDCITTGLIYLAGTYLDTKIYLDSLHCILVYLRFHEIQLNQV